MYGAGWMTRQVLTTTTEDSRSGPARLMKGWGTERLPGLEADAVGVASEEGR